MNDTPGIVTNQRIRQGMVILQVYMDNLKRSTKHLGRVLLDFIKQYYLGRAYQIVGKTGPENVPLTADLFGRYDLVVEDAPWSPNVRQETMGLLMQIVPLALQSGIPIPPQVIDYMGLPVELANDWKQMLSQPPMPPGGGMPGQMPMQPPQIAGNTEQGIPGNQLPMVPGA